MSVKRDEVHVIPDAKMVLRTGAVGQSMHAHRPLELVAALDGPVELRCDGEPMWSECFLVPPMRRHALSGYRGRIARVYFDGGYRSVAAWKDTGILTALPGRDEVRSALAPLFSYRVQDANAHATLRRWIGAWAPVQAVVASDPRVAVVLRHLDERLAPDGDRVEMARLVGLSPSRFAAVFAKDTGASLTRYLLWRRVKAALSLICAGESVTAAAAAAGFADGAHLTRSCRATYGCPPSHVVGFKLHLEEGMRSNPSDPYGCLGAPPDLGGA